jgi:hypothetical protein
MVRLASRRTAHGLTGTEQEDLNLHGHGKPSQTGIERGCPDVASNLHILICNYETVTKKTMGRTKPPMVGGRMDMKRP